MIHLTRLNGSTVVVNAILIECIEVTPDTVVTLSTGRKIVVRETVEDVVAKATAYYRSIGLVGSPAARFQEGGSRDG